MNVSLDVLRSFAPSWILENLLSTPQAPRPMGAVIWALGDASAITALAWLWGLDSPRSQMEAAARTISSREKIRCAGSRTSWRESTGLWLWLPRR